MAIHFHPVEGTILICDFTGLVPPEIIKRRPVVVVSPRIRDRNGLCTVVPMSTTPPHRMQAYHHVLVTDPPLPFPYSQPQHWVKADMIYTVGFQRLFLPFTGKSTGGTRQYDQRVISREDLQQIQRCVLVGLGFSSPRDITRI